MTTIEKVGLIALTILGVVGFVPAVKNFLVVLRDKNNSKVTPLGRRMVLVYLAVGVVCIVLGVSFCVYTLLTRA